MGEDFSHSVTTGRAKSEQESAKEAESDPDRPAATQLELAWAEKLAPSGRTRSNQLFRPAHLRSTQF
ncbi:hypothetical protein Enr13x_05260 [Stieleria neptunia]|uniref:Uncharacterized protein n=1 Tax=Stieleria neptunia TaxID=2527979 RepID=A0A518HIL1_9BACT|nr:hypothetical protein Enr13x_05260 [Stieleria neptunia]